MNFVKQLDHLNLTVKSLAASLTFYRQIFGFEVVERGEQDTNTWAIIRAGDALLCLYEEKQQRPHVEDAGPLNHFALRITNAEAFILNLKENDIPFSYGEGAVDWKHSTSWYVLDPSGIEIEVALWNDDTIRFNKAA